MPFIYDEFERVRQGRAMPHLYPRPSEATRSHAEDLRRGRRAVNIHNEPSVVNRLIRMVEELIERDDLTPDADTSWYRNRLREIKEEVRRAEAQDIYGGGTEGEEGSANQSASQEESPLDSPS